MKHSIRIASQPLRSVGVGGFTVSAAATPVWLGIAALFSLLAFVARPAVAAEPPPRIVFLINEDPDNYEAHRSIPRFAAELSRDHNAHVTVLKAQKEGDAHHFPNLHLLNDADLLVIFCRRLALPPEQITAIQAHLEAGKPLLGIRTANHAFSVRDPVPPGYRDWWEFVPEVLGCENRGYGPTASGTRVTIAEAAAGHRILQGLPPAPWHSQGNVYHVAPLLDPQATVLLHGEVQGKVEPIAWTRTAGKSRVFYTSLGHPADFETPWFRALLIGGLNWALDRAE